MHTPTDDFMMELGQLSGSAVADLAPSFDQLPPNPYIDGKFRLRRYSNFRFTDGKLTRLPSKAFVQTGEINQFQGGVARSYPDLEDAMVASDGMKEMFQRFMDMTGMERDRVIEVHQMRILANEDDTPPAPEGVHQDGFDYLGVYGIARRNIAGADLLVYNERDEDPFFRLAMDQGRFAVINDRQFWHNASPMNRSGEDLAYWDIFVLTA